MSITRDEWAEVVEKSLTSNLEVRDSEEHRGYLEAVIRQYAVRPVKLLIVDDISKWWKTVGNKPMSSNPTGMAVHDLAPHGDWGIVLRRYIDSESVKNDFSTSAVYGFPKANLWLDTAEKFLEHLVLHDLAHLLNQGWVGKDHWKSDEWAFEKMGLIGN